MSSMVEYLASSRITPDLLGRHEFLRKEFFPAPQEKMQMEADNMPSLQASSVDGFFKSRGINDAGANTVGFTVDAKVNTGPNMG